VEDVERRVLYFGFCGEANTEKLLQAVRRRCGETLMGHVVVASETGRSARLVEGGPQQVLLPWT
jgi:hypothetical protein